MDVRVHGKNMRVDDAVNDMALDKIGHASRIFDDGSVADVEFSELRNPRSAGERFKVEITSHTAGHTVRVASRAPDAASAVDLAADQLALNELSNVVQASTGYYLVEVLEITPNQLVSDEHWPLVLQASFQTWLANERAQAEIAINPAVE